MQTTTTWLYLYVTDWETMKWVSNIKSVIYVILIHIYYQESVKALRRKSAGMAFIDIGRLSLGWGTGIYAIDGIPFSNFQLAFRTSSMINVFRKMATYFCATQDLSPQPNGMKSKLRPSAETGARFSSLASHLSGSNVSPLAKAEDVCWVSRIL